ncbi:MAG: hypothetical protein EWM47_00205 [Anaerolineaceae bacterium]|nr:MAG: hypothetical protein EWM47_00205 [Anaerolineaceae bacterium]
MLYCLYQLCMGCWHRVDFMDKNITNKKYEAYKIPGRRQEEESGATKNLQKNKMNIQISLDDLFYEIEYDNSPIKGAGKFVLKSQKIEASKKDEIREIFYRMRDISRQYPLPYSTYSRFFDKRVQGGNARIFYKQAVFMKGFEDNYPEQVPFSSYFPYYQMMGYEQLRTYFTWRTNVREGLVGNTSLSYVFLYIYELLNNIGVDSPQEGLDKLMSFWISYRSHDSSIDKYVIRWLKDYHIYYNLPRSFKEFVKEHNLSKHYPNIMDKEDSFDLYCAISKYDIKKSAFFTDDTSKLISDSFFFVIEKIRQEFETVGIQLQDTLFHPTKKIVDWSPFKDALFYNWLKQADKKVVVSENEIYICTNNVWKFSTIISSDNGRQFIAYVMKQMESVLRKVTKYKFKITANINMLGQEMLTKLEKAGLDIEHIVNAATIEFYREATKTVVEVNHASLARIRQEALTTQEALIVEEQKEAFYSTQLQVELPLVDTETYDIEAYNIVLSDTESSDTKTFYTVMSDREFTSESDSWESLKDALSDNELQALAIILQGNNDNNISIKLFADNKKIMLEVLADGINEKAMDYIGDNILDDELAIYEDYQEQVKEMVE